MIFNSFEFLILFLPLVAVLFFAAKGHRALLLALSSFAFYGVSGLDHLATLIFGIAWVYLITAQPDFSTRPIKLALAICGPVVALLYFKYSSFLLVDVLHIRRTDNPEVFSLFDSVVLPAGISFFTFQLVSFAIDKYRNKFDNQPTIIDFSLYISFFPQLVAGPILRFDQVKGHISHIGEFVPTRDQLSTFVILASYGLFLKVMIADSLGETTSSALDGPGQLGVVDAASVLLSYSFQIYFDFYGYSLIAIGLGALFGFSFPNNFLRPYNCLNPRDFWRRWHTTLSYWIRDYLYLPLGGNRRYTVNILIVFAVCGLWHGAGFSFVLWGLYHAALVIAYHYTSTLWDRAPKLFQWATTFSAVSAGWLLFLFDLDELTKFLASASGANGIAPVLTDSGTLLSLLAAAFFCFAIRIENWRSAGQLLGMRKAPLVAGASLALGVALGLALLNVESSTTFIYFRF